MASIVNHLLSIREQQVARRYADDRLNRSDPFAYVRMISHLRNGVETIGGERGVKTWLNGRGDDTTSRRRRR